MSHYKKFKKVWITFWKEIGYGLHSSEFLIKSMLQYVSWDSTNTIIELGAGYGAVTRNILSRKNHETHLTVCEVTEERYHSLKQLGNTYCDIHHEDALTCLRRFPDGSVDVIVSTLPLGSLDKEVSRHILEEAQRTLRPNGRFLQYQYWLVNKQDVKDFFHIEKIKWEPRNFGPAFIYVARK